MATSALHITLGVFLKIFKLLEETCKQLDYQLSHYLLKKHYDLHSMSQQIEGIFRLHDYIRQLEDGVNKCTEHYNWKMPSMVIMTLNGINFKICTIITLIV